MGDMMGPKYKMGGMMTSRQDCDEFKHAADKLIEKHRENINTKSELEILKIRLNSIKMGFTIMKTVISMISKYASEKEQKIVNEAMSKFEQIIENDK
jgi:hypothetical protein